MFRPRRWIFAILFASTLSAQQVDPAEKAREDFARIAESSSLLWDMNALRRYGQLDDEEVLENLLELYDDPPRRDPWLQDLAVATVRWRYDPLCRALGFRSAQQARVPDEDELETIEDFAAKETRKDVHAWAAFNAFCILSRHRQEGALLEALDGDRSVLRRVAALTAMAEHGDPRLLERLPGLLAETPRKKEERVWLQEASLWAAADAVRARLVEDTGHVFSDAERDRARALGEGMIAVLENKKTLPRTARHARLALQHALDAPRAYREAESWRLALQDARVPERNPDEGTVVRFMGIETTGTRIAFLLDASDSMLNPLTDAEKAALEELFGPRALDASSTRERGDPLRVDWEGVETRFDAAREHLRSTLAGMDDEREIAVILFGDEARTLDETPVFVAAGEKQRRAIALALDAIEAGPESDYRPHGTLRGQTNLLAAFELAFRLGSKGTAPPGTRLFTDDKALLRGVDAIYLLSDGKPTRDGHGGESPVMTIGGYWREAYEGETVDPETGTRRKIQYDRAWIPERTQALRYVYGPYTQTDPLLVELSRLNLFRKAIVHVIGIGEADLRLPEEIARLGRGRWINFGSGEDEEDEEGAAADGSDQP